MNKLHVRLYVEFSRKQRRKLHMSSANRFNSSFNRSAFGRTRTNSSSRHPSVDVLFYFEWNPWGAVLSPLPSVRNVINLSWISIDNDPFNSKPNLFVTRPFRIASSTSPGDKSFLDVFARFPPPSPSFVRFPRLPEASSYKQKWTNSFPNEFLHVKTEIILSRNAN